MGNGLNPRVQPCSGERLTGHTDRERPRFERSHRCCGSDWATFFRRYAAGGGGAISLSLRSFRAGQCVDIGNLLITPFPKLHDAIEPLSFAITCKEINIGVFTDIGSPCKDVINQFKRCHAAFLETNYDDTMLDNGSYPHHLKNRIRGGKGHLSNKQALDLFIQHRPSFMTHLFLSHLSKNNNCTELVYQLFHANAAGVKIIVASRYEETSLYNIAGVSNKIYPAIKRGRGFTSTVQLSFAFQ